VGGGEPPRDAPRREEPAGAGSTDGGASSRPRRDVAGACESGDSEESVSLLTELDAFLTDHRLRRPGRRRRGAGRVDCVSASAGRGSPRRAEAGDALDVNG
jgi:hypothetical protein